MAGPTEARDGKYYVNGTEVPQGVYAAYVARFPQTVGAQGPAAPSPTPASSVADLAGLTKADIDAHFKAGRIPEGDYRQFLSSMGITGRGQDLEIVQNSKTATQIAAENREKVDPVTARRAAEDANTAAREAAIAQMQQTLGGAQVFRTTNPNNTVIEGSIPGQAGTFRTPLSWDAGEQRLVAGTPLFSRAQGTEFVRDAKLAGGERRGISTDMELGPGVAGAGFSTIRVPPGGPSDANIGLASGNDAGFYPYDINGIRPDIRSNESRLASIGIDANQDMFADLKPAQIESMRAGGLLGNLGGSLRDQVTAGLGLTKAEQAGYEGQSGGNFLTYNAPGRGGGSSSDTYFLDPSNILATPQSITAMAEQTRYDDPDELALLSGVPQMQARGGSNVAGASYSPGSNPIRLRIPAPWNPPTEGDLYKSFLSSYKPSGTQFNPDDPSYAQQLARDWRQFYFENRSPGEFFLNRPGWSDFYNSNIDPGTRETLVTPSAAALYADRRTRIDTPAGSISESDYANRKPFSGFKVQFQNQGGQNVVGSPAMGNPLSAGLGSSVGSPGLPAGYTTPEEVAHVGLKTGRVYAVTGEGADGLGGGTAPERVTVQPLTGQQQMLSQPPAPTPPSILKELARGLDRRIPVSFYAA